MNIGIIGCGPAGLAVALFLKRAGHDVELLERFSTPHAVGSGFILQPTGLAVLAELGLSKAISKKGQRLDRIYGLTEPSGRVVLDVDYSALGKGFHGIGVHRASLFEHLFEAVTECAITIRTDIDVTRVESSPDIARVFDQHGQHYGDYDLVIDASGASSSLRQFSLRTPASRTLDYGALWGSFRWPGAPFAKGMLEQRYVGAHTMIGVLPIGRHSGVDHDLVAFFWSLKTTDFSRWLEAGLDVWKQQVRRIWPATDSILDQIHEPADMTLAKYGHSTMTKPFGDKLAFIGDAAHSTSPQLGQGANMALLDAWSLAQALAGPGALDERLRTYAKTRRWHIRAFQWSSLAMTPFYQSDSRVLAALRDRLFNPVSKLPIARRIVAGLISGMLAGPPKDLDYSAGMHVPEE
ncbi:MAG: NAD(P)/FAD-dependent oxidoreductase [Pseudomonadota bacterium]